MGGLRSFVDANGTSWEVWEVHPRGLQLDAPERRGAERRQETSSAHALERRRRERRLGRDAAPASSWLVFRSATERRRLTPVPDGWAEADAADLERFCRAARPHPSVI